MNLMKRIKDILFDEEEIEIPVIEKEKTEPTNISGKIEVDEIKEIKMPSEDFSDKDTLKSELTFPFPIEFDENELEKTKPIERFERKTEPRTRDSLYRENYYNASNNTKKTREIKDYSSYLKTKEEKKQFKPTPIISPVYGVLDQNYKKEDLIIKNEIKRPNNNKNKPNLDDVRKKVYGESDEINKKIEIIDEPELDVNKTIGELFEEEFSSIETPKLDNTKDEEPTVELNDLIDEKERIEKKLQEEPNFDDEETDLFSLIDSMYEENNE